MLVVDIMVGRARGRKLAEELTEAFAKDDGRLELTVYAQANVGEEEVTLQFSCEREWENDEQVTVDIDG